MPVDGLVLFAAFASGLLGSVHCAAMCGGIATGLSLGQREGLWMAALPNLGRVLGYAIGGAVVGGLGGGLLDIVRVPELGIAILRHALDTERGRRLDGDVGDGDPGGPQRLPKLLARGRRRDPQGVVRVHPQHEVDTTLEIEPET